MDGVVRTGWRCTSEDRDRMFLPFFSPLTVAVIVRPLLLIFRWLKFMLQRFIGH